jgi:hypothetical protein
MIIYTSWVTIAGDNSAEQLKGIPWFDEAAR